MSNLQTLYTSGQTLVVTDTDTVLLPDTGTVSGFSAKIIMTPSCSEIRIRPVGSQEINDVEGETVIHKGVTLSNRTVLVVQDSSDWTVTVHDDPYVAISTDNPLPSTQVSFSGYVGEATLITGTKDVTIPSGVARVLLQRKSGTSADFGHLTYSISGTTLTITSSDADDVSVVEWFALKQ